MGTYTPNLNLYKPDASDPFGEFRAKFNDNMDILDNGGGGGSGDVEDVEVNGISVLNPVTKVAEITSYKEVTQAQYDALPASKLTDGIAYFIKDGGGSGSGGSFLLMITADTGETVTATKDGTTLTATEVSTGVYEVEVTSAGTWTISDGTNTATVDVGIYTATLSSVPEGSTVLPTDDVSIWLACGERTEGYTTLSQVLGDSVCLSALLNSNNANDYLVRSTTWASTITADSSAMSYIGLNNYCSNTLLSDATWCEAICNSEYFESVLNVKVPVMTSNTTPSGECFGRTYQSGHEYYRAFDGSLSTEYWSTDANNEYLGYKYPSNRTIYVFKGEVANNVGSANPITLYLQGSEDNVSYTNLADAVSYTLSASEYKMFTILATNIMANQYFRILRTVGANRFRLRDVQFYGREDV